MDTVGSFAAQLITSASRAYAIGAVERQLAIQPRAAGQWGAAGFDDLAGDTRTRLSFLAEAVAVDRGELFFEQIRWVKVAMVARRLPLDVLRVNLQCTAEELGASLPAEAAAPAVAMLREAEQVLEDAPSELPSLLEDDAPLQDLCRRYLLAVLETRRYDAIDLLLAAADEGVPVPELQRDVVARAQAELGRMWQMDEVHVAEEHFGTVIAMEAMAALRTRLPRAPEDGRRVLCATASGELHDLGVRLVSDSLEAAGWQAMCLGASVPAPDLVRGVVDFEAGLVAISISIALHVRRAISLIEFVRQEVPQVPILVGGAPFRVVPDLWQIVGAHAQAMDAMEAVEVAERLVVERVR